jgi:sigma-B regulation protein RsbU (phosphoserine phosphatase)
MGPAPGPRILLFTDAPAEADDVGGALEGAGYAVGRHLLGDPEPPDLGPFHLVVIDGGRAGGDPPGLCRRLRARRGDRFVPLLHLIADASPAARVASLEAGADAYLLRPFAPAELLAQVRAFLSLKERHDGLAEKAAEVHRVNQRLQFTYEQLDQELELAHRIQRSFLPQTLPEPPRTRFAVHYRPSGRVGGDFYDVFRLDERHVGFYVADAMGHGVPAGLLTIFVKMGVRTKEVRGRDYRLLPPGEVLGRLNRELMDQALSENPFITMVYVLLDHQEGTLHFARSGHPYPLYVPHRGEPELWKVEGCLMGIFDTAFPVQTHRLRPGDKVLLYTDGMDGAVFEDHPGGARSVLACAARHRELPVEEFVSRMAQDLFRASAPGDDLTLLGVELLPDPSLAA